MTSHISLESLDLTSRKIQSEFEDVPEMKHLKIFGNSLKNFYKALEEEGM